MHVKNNDVRTRTPQVLIVDDDPTVGLLAKETLQQANFHAAVAQSAAKCGKP
jgi:DNA-binding response OmpR family regulator